VAGDEQVPLGSSRPGPNPQTNALVKLNRNDGKMIWARQVLPHDVYDWDLQLPPILTKEGSRDLVLVAGKQGYVYAIDAGSGAITWKTSVGHHNGHDHDNELALKGEYNNPKHPVTCCRRPRGVETQMALADGVVYAPIVNIASVFKTQEKLSLDIPKGTGAMVALNVSDGSLKWQRDLPQPAYGAATVSNDLVFTTTFEGKVIAST